MSANQRGRQGGAEERTQSTELTTVYFIGMPSLLYSCTLLQQPCAERGDVAAVHLVDGPKCVFSLSVGAAGGVLAQSSFE